MRRTDERGQAVVEYILMLVLVISFVGMIAFGFRSSVVKLWQSFSRDVSAACPRDCPPKENIRIR